MASRPSKASFRAHPVSHSASVSRRRAKLDHTDLAGTTRGLFYSFSNAECTTNTILIGTDPMAKAKEYKGGCLCGAIRFEATGPALKPHSCSCKMCQRHTGALTAAWVEFPADNVVWTGEGGEPAKFRSSEVSSRAFCPACGSSLGAIDDAPVIALLLGTFDRAGSRELAPTAHSFKGGRPKWWKVDVEV